MEVGEYHTKKFGQISLGNYFTFTHGSKKEKLNGKEALIKQQIQLF